MARCPNRNTEEYKILLEQFGNNIMTDNVINKWQDETKSEDFPTVEQALAFRERQEVGYNLKTREFGDALLSNLSRLKIMSKYNDSYYLNNSAPTSWDPNTWEFNAQVLRNNLSRMYRYLDTNLISRDAIKAELTKNRKTYKITIDNSIFTPQDIQESSKLRTTPRSYSLLGHLSRLFPQLNIAVLTPTEAEEFYKKLPEEQKAKVPFADVKSFYVDGTAILIKGRTSNETAIEEVLHPFIDSLLVDNPDLYNNLLEEAKENFPVLWQQIQNSYSNARGFGDLHRGLELVTQALSRHFNNEYENNPTRSFRERVKEFLNWFADIIKNFHQYVTGKQLVVKPSMLKPETKLTDIAKLLNTSDVVFEIEKVVDRKVRYSLKPDVQAALDKAINTKDITPMQAEVLKKLTHAAINTDKEVPTFSAGLADLSKGGPVVVLNEEDHTYMDIMSGRPFISASLAVSGVPMSEEKKISNKINLDIGNDFDSLLTGILTDKLDADMLKDLQVLNKEQAEKAIQTLRDALVFLTAGGGIAIPQVVLFDETTGIAGTADVLIVMPDGKIKVVDLKTSKQTVKEEALYEQEWDLSEKSMLFGKGVTRLSKKARHGLQVSMYRRMLENMGYEIADAQDNYAMSTFHIKVDIEGKGKNQKFLGTFKLDDFIQHEPGDNITNVNYLIPQMVDPLIMEEMEDMQNEFGESVTVDDILDESEQMPEEDAAIGQEDIATISGALETYKRALLDKKKALETIRSQIYMDKAQTKKGVIENIIQTVTTIDIESEYGRSAISALYTDLLQQGLKEVRSFKEYVQDPKNFSNPEYISYVLNYDRFIETYRGLYKLNETASLNKTQKDLVLQFTAQLNSLNDKNDPGGGIINSAITNYVREVIRNRSSKDFTEQELDELMQFASDISLTEYATGDMATSPDRILQIMDKIYKSKKQELLDKLEVRDNMVRERARKLQRLSPETDPQKMYHYMLEFDENGVPTGNYVKKAGDLYNDTFQKLRDQLIDDDGKWKEYIPITDIENASQEELEYNKNLYELKQEYSNFYRAHSKSASGRPTSGEYHEYTPEFLEIRKQYEDFIPNGEHGYWVKKANRLVSRRAYAEYKAKYFDKSNEYYRMVKVDGVPTGKVILTKGYDSVKREYIRPLDNRRSDGQPLTSEKYRKIMNPTNELERAQKEFYLMFVQVYEKELLNKLPLGQKNQMNGKVPLIKAQLYQNLKEKPNIISRLTAKMSRSWSNLTTSTAEQKAVLTDEKGNLVNSMPIFYTGNPRTEKELEAKQAEIDLLDKKRKEGKIGIVEYKEKRDILKNQFLKLQDKPTLGELNLDMGTALLKFNAMAEHYETMNQAEDTFKAMIKVIERRQYDPSADTKLYRKTRSAIAEKIERVGKPGNESNTLRRAKKWMSMVFYDNDNMTRSVMDKLADGLISFSSLSYVAFNPFGNFNNYVLGRINNSIEAIGGRYFSASSYARATRIFNQRAIPDLMKRTGYFVADVGDIATGNKLKMSNKYAYDPTRPGSKYEAFVDLFRMMDTSTDIRESGRSADKATRSWFDRASEFGYILQDAAEYNVQTKVGMAILMDITIRNEKTGDEKSLYDAFDFDSESKSVKLKEGYDTIVNKDGTTQKYTDEYRYDIRNKIREVNKQIHGNYAREDRMVIQSHSVGRLAAQFHKWVAPAIKARFRKEYYDENLGWVEGRYKSALKFSAYVMKSIAKGNMNIRKIQEDFKKEYDPTTKGAQGIQKAENVIFNTYRTLGEIGIMMMTYGLTSLLKGMFGDDDDDSDFEKRLENFLIYQADRTAKEMVLLFPIAPDSWQQIHQFVKSPIASTRTLGEMGELFSLGLWTPIGYLTSSEEDFYADSDYVYQRGRRAGELKLNKAWKDVFPIAYSIQKWTNYIDEKDFFIK
jgi:hypothetical protein